MYVCKHIYIYIYIYIYAALLKFEDDMVYLLLELQYLITPADHLYLARWFLYLASIGDQCLFLTYQHSLNVFDLC